MTFQANTPFERVCYSSGGVFSACHRSYQEMINDVERVTCVECLETLAQDVEQALS